MFNIIELLINLEINIHKPKKTLLSMSQVIYLGHIFFYLV